ncbi:hypothetical protein ACFOQM_05185 [Paenibacillus sp. GCM10012307]|uniref:Copper amine oxidase-like N-terminal domain-containing protein n=1 Tax=Paenibacillus roseus TaxID=2798579 RepID=A0A934MPS5_9BACL|nr:hypothetical protein [Paenibacillus roseus]MBJ6360699.1 hypothetical protein [Paenibacillus roseus]
MKHKKALVILTAVGVLGATAVTGASGLVDKVSGLLRSDIKIVVNGEQTTLQPVYINGKAYLPVRDAAGVLGYEVNAAGKQIQLQTKKEQPPVDEENQHIQMNGVVVSKTDLDGITRLEVRGDGAGWMILGIDSDSVIVNEDGVAKTIDDIREGTALKADYGPIVAMSYPGKSHAAKLVISTDRLVREDTVTKVSKSEDGWQIFLGPENDAQGLQLNTDSDTIIVKANGERLKPEDLKTGTKIKAYYGPATTRSIPAQSTVQLIVVEPEKDAAQ